MSRAPFDPRKSAAVRAVREPLEIPLLAELPGVEKIAKPMAAAGFEIPIRTVKQLNALIAKTLATELPEVFLVQGEISNFRTYDRGHAFFTLKESGAEMPCILWKDDLARLKFRPKDGMEVLARGAVKMYEPQGKVQLYVEDLTPRGTGALDLAFRQLCEKLKAEGLFEASRKRAIPRLPECVVIITSRTGSVLHDVLTTAYRRYPGLHALLFPVPVQGETAAPKIADAIAQVNRYHQQLCAAEAGGIDLILLARGGGSLEDLWPFNEEIVARAIVGSAIPVATGVGHEPDTTIADLVSDLRGATPTAVTELTIPDVQVISREIQSRAAILTRDVRRLVEYHRTQLHQHLVQFTHAIKEQQGRLQQRCEALSKLIERIEPRHAIAQGWRRVEEAERELLLAEQRRLRTASDRLTGLEFRLQKASPMARIGRAEERLNHLQGALAGSVKVRIGAARAKLESCATQLRAISPQAVLDRGFSITTDRAGKIVRSKGQVAKGDLLVTKVADGEIKSTVGEPRQAKLF